MPPMSTADRRRTRHGGRDPHRRCARSATPTRPASAAARSHLEHRTVAAGVTWSAKLGPHRVEQQVAGLGDAPADHSTSGSRTAVSAAMPRPIHDPTRRDARPRRRPPACAASVIICPPMRPASPPARSSSSAAASGRAVAAFARHPHQRGPRGVGLQAAEVAAAAGDAARDHRDVPHLGAHAETTAHQLAVEHDAATDAVRWSASAGCRRPRRPRSGTRPRRRRWRRSPPRPQPHAFSRWSLSGSSRQARLGAKTSTARLLSTKPAADARRPRPRCPRANRATRSETTPRWSSRSRRGRWPASGCAAGAAPRRTPSPRPHDLGAADVDADGEAHRPGSGCRSARPSPTRRRGRSARPAPLPRRRGEQPAAACISEVAALARCSRTRGWSAGRRGSPGRSAVAAVLAARGDVLTEAVQSLGQRLAGTRGGAGGSTGGGTRAPPTWSAPWSRAQSESAPKSLAASSPTEPTGSSAPRGSSLVLGRSRLLLLLEA